MTDHGSMGGTLEFYQYEQEEDKANNRL